MRCTQRSTSTPRTPRRNAGDGRRGRRGARARARHAALRRRRRARGPARHVVRQRPRVVPGGRPLVHPFEAHGFVKAFTFDGKGGATLTTRFVETRPCQQWEERGCARPTWRARRRCRTSRPQASTQVSGPPPERGVAVDAERRAARGAELGRPIVRGHGQRALVRPRRDDPRDPGRRGHGRRARGREPAGAHAPRREEKPLIAAAAAFDAFGDTTTTTFWEFASRTETR